MTAAGALPARGRQWVTFMTVGALLSIHASDSRAQAAVAPTRIADALSCPRCRIVVDTVATFLDSLRLSSVGAVQVDARGRYWVLTPDYGVIVFGQDFPQGHAVGRRGRGPGEYDLAASIIPVSRDSTILLTADYRALVIDADLRPVRTFLVRQNLGTPLVLRWPDSVVSSALLLTRQSAGWPLHLVSFATDSLLTLRSFGPDRGELTPQGMDRHQQRTALAIGGGFWSADVVKYRFHRWAPSLQRVATYVREPRWFIRESMNWLGNKDTPPPPLVVGVTESSDGLFLIAHRAATTWSQAWPQYPAGTTEISGQGVDFEKLYDVVAEAIDPERARLIASLSWQGRVISVLPGGRAAVAVTAADGTTGLQVLQLRVVGR